MEHAKRSFLLTLVVVVLAGGILWADAPTSATTKAKPLRQWGKAKAGLQLSLSAGAKASVRGKYEVRLALRNRGAVGVALGDAEDAFVWISAIRNRQDSWLSVKIPLTDLVDAWPHRLSGDKPIVFKPDELFARQVYPYAIARKILIEYIKPSTPSKLPTTSGELSKIISTGKWVMRAHLCIARPGQKPLILASNKFSVEVAPPALASLSRQERRDYMNAVIAKFDADAWSAKSACELAVRLGPGAARYLSDAVLHRRRADFSRMWLATALAIIPSEISAETLERLLYDTLPAVRHVVAYHGPRQKNEQLDAAIVERTLKLKESRMTALAVLGFLVFRGEANAKLLAASLDHPDPRVRTTAISAMSQHANSTSLASLTSLLADKNQRVRAAAARALGAMKKADPKIISALVTALDLLGDDAHYRICETLSALTGQTQPPYKYTPSADTKTHTKTIQAWKTWWTRQTSKSVVGSRESAAKTKHSLYVGTEIWMTSRVAVLRSDTYY